MSYEVKQAFDSIKLGVFLDNKGKSDGWIVVGLANMDRNEWDEPVAEHKGNTQIGLWELNSNSIDLYLEMQKHSEKECHDSSA